MELFGIKFREYIECQGYSIRQYAKDAGFDRSWLTNILNNKKKLPETSFSQLVNNNYFSDEQINRLRYIYYSATFTETEFEHIEYILKRFENPTNFSAYYPETLPEECTSAVIGYGNVLSLLYRIFFDEKQYFYIYTNIPASKAEHLSVIYQFLRQKGTKDYKHILYLDHGISTHNLNSYFALFNFAQIGYKISLLNNVNTVQMEMLESFPYYIMINNKMLLFNSDFESALYIDDSEKIKLYQKNFSKIYENAEQVVRYYDNPIDYINIQRHYAGSITAHESISNSYSLASLLTDDMYENSINHNLPNTQNIISALSSYYSIAKNYNSAHYITVKALMDFVKTGRIAQFPESYFEPLSVRQRIEILDIQKKTIINKQFDLKLINPTKLKYSAWTFDSDKDSLLSVNGFCDTIKDANNFLGSFSVLINDSFILKDFSNVFRFITKNNYVYSDEYYIHYIDDCINELKNRILY